MDKIAKNASLFNGDQLLKEILSYESRSYFAKILHSGTQTRSYKELFTVEKIAEKHEYIPLHLQANFPIVPHMYSFNLCSVLYLGQYGYQQPPPQQYGYQQHGYAPPQQNVVYVKDKKKGGGILGSNTGKMAAGNVCNILSTRKAN